MQELFRDDVKDCFVENHRLKALRESLGQSRCKTWLQTEGKEMLSSRQAKFRVTLAENAMNYEQTRICVRTWWPADTPNAVPELLCF